MSKHYIIPIFVPHFGCPHDCIFCNQKKITGLSTNVTQYDVEEIILKYLSYFKEDAFIEVAFYGGSFTAINLQTQSDLLEIPYKYKKKGIINEIRLSTRPDAIDDLILNNLKRYEVDTIELGVQSLDNEVLQVSERGHTPHVVYSSSKLIRDYGFKLGLQMMVGLPRDTFEKSLYTCREFIKLSPDCVRIYPTLVVKDTFLEKQYSQGIYKPLSIDEAIKQVAIFLMLFYTNNINVIRVGLQPTDNIQMGKDVVAGPFHPSFRQLVEAYIIRFLFDLYLRKKNIATRGKNLIIEANSSLISIIAGQKAANIDYWKSNYLFRSIKIFKKNINRNYISLYINDFCDNINLNKLMEEFLESYPLKTK